MVTAGIRVFRDDDELAVGDRIETILQAIDNSQLCVPIFSETFASSKWCLLEVARMVHLEKTIMPIFYKVSSDDVKLKTPKYMKSMEEHETKYAKEEVEEWKGALKAAAQFKGRELLNKSYTEFCDEFISKVLKRLGPRPKFEVDVLVGVDKQFKRLQELLNLNSADVRYIGIHGMGGIGKTSLVKDFFNRFSASFYPCDFIENVREKSLDVNGLGNLEEKVRDKLGPSLYEKKVLVVLDDVDKSEQIEKLVGKSSRFGPGSRIVVTTRDKSVLEKCKALKAEEVFLFEMEVLETRDALRLFSRCAFMKNSPPLDFEKLSQEAVSTTGNLPLALEVMGSLLRNEKREVWEDTIARSKVVPMEDVKDRLMISYDKLEYEQQQIFLDIACLPIGTVKSRAMSMWKACEFHPDLGLVVLESRCLIKLDKYDYIRMHDQLRDLGRGVVRGESNSPYKRSRLWKHGDALEVLMSKKGTENVQALCLNHHSNDITLKRKHLKKFENLRLLWMGGAKLEGEMGNILPKLRWLRWRAPAELEASNFRLPNLVTLDLSYSDIGDDWGGWRLLQGAKNLKDLILCQCLKLTRTPDFGEHMNIERLDLNFCKNLVMVHDSIGNLKLLKHLELCCTKVVRLPESVGALESLDSLDLTFLGIAELPDSIGRLTKLKRLNLSYCFALKALPPSIGNIKSLIKLFLDGTKIEELPDSIGSLDKLKVLNVGGCNLRELPDSIGKLIGLEQLYLFDCSALKVLPPSIGNIKSLIMLVLQQTKIEELPDSIESLENLKVLHVSNGSLRGLPDSISKLTKLERLCLFNCYALKALPRSIGNIKSLIELQLRETAIEELSDSIGSLENLKELDVRNCSLRGLPDSIGKLTKLERLYLLNCYALKALPHSIGNIKSLIDLQLRETAIEELPDSIGSLEKLKVLDVRDRSLRGLPDSIGKLTKLERLDLSFCSALKALPPSIGNIKSLIELRLRGTAIEELPDSIGSLENLKVLDVIDGSLRGLPDSISKLTKLEWLHLLDGYALKALPRSIGNIKSLIDLRLRETAIEALPDSIGSLKKLKVLDVDNCRLRGLPKSIVVLGMLEELHAKQNYQLEELPREITSLSCLRILNVEECHRLQEIPELPMRLHELHVESKVLKKIPDLSILNNLAIERLSELKSLNLHLGLRDDALWPSNFSHLSRLHTLDLSCRNLKTPLQLPSSLVTLLLQDVNLETELCLSDLVNLTSLSLVEWSKNNGYESLGIEHLLSLHKLFVDGCHITDGLHIPQNVRHLHIQNCEFLKKVPDLSCCKDLVDLKVSKCIMLTEISGLGELKYLSNLTIEDCISLERIEGLFKLQLDNLRIFRISNCGAVQDMPDIESFRREQARRVVIFI